MAVMMAASGSAQPGEISGPVLDVDRVSVQLAGRQILDDVCFTVGSGEFVGLNRI
jgi:ABC-type transporter Mla maintaining outer membrane lipid asymmetry ATPase subunit MlaF